MRATPSVAWIGLMLLAGCGIEDTSMLREELGTSLFAAVAGTMDCVRLPSTTR